MSADTVKADAYKLAIANRHKAWARRWLKENGHWNFISHKTLRDLSKLVAALAEK